MNFKKEKGRKNRVSFIIIIFLTSLVLGYILSSVIGEREELREEDTLSSVTNLTTHTSMKLESSAFSHNGEIPKKYTCNGENISPPLEIIEVPEGTKSLALIMYDPDVPRSIREDGIWNHWLFWNLDPKTTQLDEGKEPDVIHGITTSNTLSYVGPCPPDGEHRYYFVLYALDTELSLPEGSTREELERAMDGHILAQSELMGRYTQHSLSV